MQTLAIFVIAVAALGALAVRFGTDSRAGAWSDEQEYAARGLAWGDGTYERCASATTSYRRRVWLALLLAMAAVGVVAGLDAGTVHPQTLDTPSTIRALSEAVDTSNVDELTRLFKQDALVQNGDDHVGTDEVRQWAQGVFAEGLQIQLEGSPDIGPSSGDPFPGEWIIWSARFTREGTSGLKLDPLDGSLAAIVKDGHIAYLSVRPHFLWQRRLDQEQADEIIVRAQQPVQVAGAASRVSIPWATAPVVITAILVAVAFGLRHRQRSRDRRSGQKTWLMDALRRRQQVSGRGSVMHADREVVGGPDGDLLSRVHAEFVQDIGRATVCRPPARHQLSGDLPIGAPSSSHALPRAISRN